MAESSVVGLDIGSSSIRGVQISKNGKGKISIDKVGYIALPQGACVSGVITDEPAVTAALKTLWKKSRFSTNELRLGIGADATLARVGEVEWAPDKDLQKILPYTDLVKYGVIHEINDYYFDYHTLGEDVKRIPAPDDPDETIVQRTKLILVAGGTKVAVDALVRTAMKANLKPISIDINGLALVRAFNSTEEAQVNAIDISMDIGADAVTLVIHARRQPLYMRTTVEGAGQSMTEKIAKSLRLSLDKAELRKFETLYADMAGGEVNTGSDDEEEMKRQERASKIRTMLNESTSGIITSMRSSIEHFFNSDAGKELDTISSFMLSGGVALMPGLAERISSEFQAPVYIAEPLEPYMSPRQFKNLSNDIKNTQPAFSVAFGLAIGEGFSHA